MSLRGDFYINGRSNVSSRTVTQINEHGVVAVEHSRTEPHLPSAGNFKNPAAISAVSIGAVDFFAACRTGLARYDKIDTDAHQENRNKEKQILYGCKHSNLHCDVVGQKDIKAKNNQGAADHKETSFDS